MKQSFSYWEKQSFLAGFDVIVIGSGIVGLSAALELKSKNPLHRIGILEAGFLPSGASTKNAGFACFGSVSEAISEIKNGGEDNFLELVQMRWEGLSKLRKNLGDETLSYKKYGGFEIFKEDEIALKCIDEISRLNDLLFTVIGKHDIYAVANAKIADFGFSGVKYLIENRYEGQIDAGKMMAALIAKVTGLGVHIFNSCRVQEFETDSDEHYLKSDQGIFKCKSIIVATNAFVKSLLPELEVVPGRGQVLVTEPVKNLKVRGAFHFNGGYTYFRNIDNRILLGGFRNLDIQTEQTIKPGLTDLIQNSLENLLHETILPGIKTNIEHRWSGVMGFGPELKPIVKKIRPGVYCAVRCSGMGIAMGSLIGEQVANLVEH